MTTTLTARGPEDLLAPSRSCSASTRADSLVLLTFGAPRALPRPRRPAAARRRTRPSPSRRSLLEPAGPRGRAGRVRRLHRRRGVWPAGSAGGAGAGVRARGDRGASTCCASTTAAGAGCRRPGAAESAARRYDDGHASVRRPGGLRGARHPCQSREALRDTLDARRRRQARLGGQARQRDLVPPGRRRRGCSLGALACAGAGSPTGRGPSTTRGAARVLALAATGPRRRDAALGAVTRASGHGTTSGLGRRCSAGRPSRPGAERGRAAGVLRLAGRRRRPGLVRARPVLGPSTRITRWATCCRRVPDPRRPSRRVGGGRPRRRWLEVCRRSDPVRMPGHGPRVTAWGKTSTHRSSPGPTARGTARRSAAASTCSRGCCSEARFDTDDPMTGLEVELNLVDDDGRPGAEERRGAGARSPTRLPDRARRSSTSRSTCRRALLRDGGSGFEADLRRSLNDAEAKSADEVGAHMVMIGILPTLGAGPPRPVRRSAPTRATSCSATRSCTRAARTSSSTSPGRSGCVTTAESILPEAACTSTQFHIQTSPGAVRGVLERLPGDLRPSSSRSAPTRRTCLGKELWRETRIPLFEQATDTRSEELKAQGVRPRVWFGERWINSIFDLFEENVRYFPALLPITDDEDPLAVLEAGGTPTLARAAAAQRHHLPLEPARSTTSSTAVPHLRVENRVLAGRPDRGRH